jgi:lysine 2,3-aminomutase
MTNRTMTIRTIDGLTAAGLAAEADASSLAAVAARYAVAITPAVAALIDAADPDDPIARQYVPSMAELVTRSGELADPIGDHAHMPVEGVVHRYPDRALLKVIHACPVYCRFCFRREMVGPGGEALSGRKFEEALDYLARQPEIREVILTGGDPFMLSARKAADLTARLAAMDHVKVIRWHTRVPFADSGRVTEAFVRAIGTRAAAVYVGVHANHAREFSEDARMALSRLANAGIVLVSQSVLLRGVNDDVETLAALMRAFVENRVKPYYLHHPDLAPGTGHFRLSIREGQALVRALRGKLSGLAQPQYVIDIPGGHGKSPIGPSYLAEDGASLRDWRGLEHKLQA